MSLFKKKVYTQRKNITKHHMMMSLQVWMFLIFMIIFLRMECGSILVLMGMCGSPATCPTAGVLIPVDVGFGQTMAGCGALGLYGVGLLFIMDGGTGIETLVGSGYLGTSGDLAGSPGAVVICI
jgi:hypothetical protein